METWIDAPSGEPSDHRRFDLVRCVECGTAVTVGDPPDMSDYQEGAYTPRPPRALPLVRTLQRATIGQPVRQLRRAGVKPGARVLDVGAGPGRLVAALRHSGYEASGIEPSPRSADAAIAKGLPVIPTSIEEHTASDLDAAVMWHVLEHLDQPLEALMRIRGWLRPGGVMLVGVPNVSSLQAKLGGEAWWHLDVPRHRVHYTPAGLEALFKRSGFDDFEVHHQVWEHNPPAMWMSLMSRLSLPPAFAFHLLKRNVKARPRDIAVLVAGLPLIPLAAIAEVLAGAARRGGTVMALARRSDDA
jgi:SAM-dependent methyltransferase